MSRHYRDERNEFGDKHRVQLRIRGILLDRTFRNDGEAIKYLKDIEGFTKDDIRRFVKIIRG